MALQNWGGGSDSHAVVEAELRCMRFGRSGGSTQRAAILRGRGAEVIDVDGLRYLDLFAGAGRCILGHGDRRFARVIADQAAAMIASRHPHPLRARYVHDLVERMPDGMDHVSFFSTGSEAVDAAMRMASSSTGRRDVIVFDGAFHGRIGSMADLTDPAWLSGDVATTQRRVTRCAYPQQPVTSHSTELAVCSALRAYGPEVAAVLVEPVQGTAGNRRIAPGAMAVLAAECKRQGVLLLLDEIFTGFGRTGAMFAMDLEGVWPDVLIIGKGMANGLPVGAVVSSAELAQAPPAGRSGSMSSTFGGNPLTIAACVATLAAIDRYDYPAKVRELGTQWLDRLRLALRNHPLVEDIFGTGLMIGLRLSHALLDIEGIFLRRGLLIGCNGLSIRLNPPFVITDAQLEIATTRIEDALDDLLVQVEE